MSWIQRLGRYTGYQASNYVSRASKNVCKKTLENEISKLTQNTALIPSVINGQYFYGNEIISHVAPSYNKPLIYNYSYLHEKNYDKLNDFQKSRDTWKKVPVEKKFEIFERVADLVENKYFYKMMAATMVGQGKNYMEAELDAIAETVDFLRFNMQYAAEIYNKQPIGENNYSQYLPLQGRVAAITPFNFTAIAANLSTSPLYFGNVVYWKPSEKSLLSNYLYYQICLEAGIPPEVLHFVLMKPDDYIERIVRDRCGGVLFTGSTQAFTNILSNINYKQIFPRIIGETGGKNFHFVDHEADLDLVVEKTYQSAYGYSGQKCSACSILYLPDTMLEEFTERFNQYHATHHPAQKETYCLIGKHSFNQTVNVLKNAENNSSMRLLMGGNYDETSGFYVEPTMFHVNQGNELLKRELFAPILLVRTYPTVFRNMAIHECANNSEYKLTGAIFSKNINFLNEAAEAFDGSCGNFYVNDKSTGSVVGQQPFGGFGKSGTNDKAGDINFMMRLYSQRNIKDSTDYV